MRPAIRCLKLQCQPCCAACLSDGDVGLQVHSAGGEVSCGKFHRQDRECHAMSLAAEAPPALKLIARRHLLCSAQAEGA